MQHTDVFVPMPYDFRPGHLTFSCVTLALHRLKAKVSFRPCALITSVAKRMNFQFTETFHARYFVLNKSLQCFLKISWDNMILLLLFSKRSFHHLNSSLLL